MAKPKLRDLGEVTAKRMAATRRIKCATCRNAVAVEALRDLERDMARSPGKYVDLGLPDVMVWCGTKARYDAFRRHVVNHQPALWAALRGAK